MDYPLFDAHCDTMSKLLDEDKRLYRNDCHIDIEKLFSYFSRAQVFAAFVTPPKAFERAEKIIDKYYEELKKNAEFITHCNSLPNIEKAFLEKKVASLLSIEGGDALDGKMENLFYFYKRGVRFITLTWNYANELGDGILEEKHDGLTEFGKEVVKNMNKLGMVVDVSHLSEKTFWDVMNTTRKPIVATHSNARHICKNPRNLNDKQIKAIIDSGGWIGINLYTKFLSDSDECRVENVAEHIKYFLDMGAENNIGFGSDFDGMKSLPNGIESTRDMSSVIDRLMNDGISETVIKKIMFDNFKRVAKQVL